MRGHVHPAECDGLGEMSGPVPETLTSIHNKTGWNLLFWGGGGCPGRHILSTEGETREPRGKSRDSCTGYTRITN